MVPVAKLPLQVGLAGQALAAEAGQAIAEAGRVDRHDVPDVAAVNALHGFLVEAGSEAAY